MVRGYERPEDQNKHKVNHKIKKNKGKQITLLYIDNDDKMKNNNKRYLVNNALKLLWWSPETRGKSKLNDFFEPSPKIITKLHPVTHKVNKIPREEERL